ncbi:TlpA family protein disulfide reductase [Fulvivirga ligni]|uniref:TlpA family protein disulfide reductase n=1 Tax=Fulvivirga ligni TaxID=2904246 RepID=UPI001F488FBA|nr:TlpA disulfide reductase family protein [Fulvivirga ligni]UII19435.1 TlpA family protein disulfide reductase [Fulvivirga ligni]
MRYFLILLAASLLTACNQNTEQTTGEESQPKTPQLYYKDLITGKTLSKKEYLQFRKKLQDQYANNSEVAFHLYDKSTSEDSVIQEFKYTVKQGHEYIFSGSKANLFSYLNKQFPKKEFTTLRDGSISLAQEGKPMMINFWFTQCAPCVREIPILNRIKEQYKDQMDFVAMTFSKKDEVNKFTQKHPFQFTQVVDAASFIDSLGIMDYPTTIFIDKEGKLLYVEKGVEDQGEEFEKLVKELI